MKFFWSIVITFVLFQIAKFLVWCYTTLMMRVDVVQLSPLPDGPRIIALNHPSVTDPFVVANLLKRRSYILIIGYIFELVVVGALLRKLGHIPVVEGSGQKALDRALELLKRGETVVIFPEGEISPKSGEFRSAHTGVARLALASGAPVVPIGIHLMDKYLKRFVVDWQDHRENSAWYPKGPYYVTIGAPMRFVGDVEDRPLVRQTADDVMGRIIELAHFSEQRMNRALDRLSQRPVWQGLLRMRARI